MLHIFKFRTFFITILYSFLILNPTISFGADALLKNNEVLLFRCLTKTPLQFTVLYSNDDNRIYFNKYNINLLIEHDPMLDIQEQNITEGRVSEKKIVRGRIDNVVILLFLPPPSDDIDDSYLVVENPAIRKTDIFVCDHSRLDQLGGGSNANGGIYSIDKFVKTGSIDKELNWINIR